MSKHTPTSKKAISLAEEIKSILRIRLPTETISEGFDTDFAPWFRIGSADEGEDGILIKVRPIEWPLARDVLGLESTIFTPHVIQCAVEEDGGGLAFTTGNLSFYLTILGELLYRGTKVEIFAAEAEQGAKPGLAAIDDDKENLIASYEADVQYPMMASQ